MSSFVRRARGTAGNGNGDGGNRRAVSFQLPDFQRANWDEVGQKAANLQSAISDTATQLHQSVASITTNLQQNISQTANQLQQACDERSKAALQYVRSTGERHIGRLRRRQRPLCFKILQRVYHEYGMKHLLLMLSLVLYTVTWALIFVVIEQPAEREAQRKWAEKTAQNRSIFVHALVRQVFNNTKYYCYLNQPRTEMVEDHLRKSLSTYENAILGIKFSDQKMPWDYWNAVLFAGTLCTTIGYGHIYPRTSAGRILTMISALGGIPLVLLVLQDLGKLLTIFMKYPWFQFKRAFRRSLRYCTKQSMMEIARIERDERNTLQVFDLPIPVAVFLVLGWILLGAVLFSAWDGKWTYLEAFYFFFISLSTVGLGDLQPTDSRLLLMMFGYIIVGLSLVSMTVNLLQTQLQRTYEAGARSRAESMMSLRFDQQQTPPSGGVGSEIANIAIFDPRSVATLGIFQSTSRASSTCGEMLPPLIQPADIIRAAGGDLLATTEVAVHMAGGGGGYRQMSTMVNRAAQTNISLPIVRQVVLTADGVHWITNWAYSGAIKSPDEVTRLVETDTEVQVLHDIGEDYKDETTEQTECERSLTNSVEQEPFVTEQ